MILCIENPFVKLKTPFLQGKTEILHRNEVLYRRK